MPILTLSSAPISFSSAISLRSGSCFGARAALSVPGACEHGFLDLRVWHHAGTVVRPLRDCRLVHIQMLGNQCRRRMRQPVGQGNLLIAGRPEDADKLQVRVADILDVMSEIALH